MPHNIGGRGIYIFDSKMVIKSIIKGCNGVINIQLYLHVQILDISH